MALWLARLGIVSFFVGFGTGVSGDEASDAQGVFAHSLLAGGVLLAAAAAFVGVVGRRRLRPGERDDQLSKGVRTAGIFLALLGLVVGVGTLNVVLR